MTANHLTNQIFCIHFHLHIHIHTIFLILAATITGVLGLPFSNDSRPPFEWNHAISTHVHTHNLAYSRRDYQWRVNHTIFWWQPTTWQSNKYSRIHTMLLILGMTINGLWAIPFFDDSRPPHNQITFFFNLRVFIKE